VVLEELAVPLEFTMGRPVDLECSYHGGKRCLLQCRQLAVKSVQLFRLVQGEDGCMLFLFARVLARSGIEADDLVPVGRLLVGVSGPHEERVVEEAPDELHADWETS
jgi:hypothetical protein